MDEFLIAFITGLTTGGLSCLAVQGGLLANSVASEVERSVNHQAVVSKKGKVPKILRANAQIAGRTAVPIGLFLASKLVAYTLLGFLLGWLGSMLTLTPTMRAVFLLAIGIFMVGNALRMLDVHPIFRYFTIQPPSFITRYIRRKAKNDTEIATPLFLGALTVLIPCGVTQAMMAAALASGSSLQGAAIMFAFTLGASPVFFGVVYLATQIGARLEKYFMRFVAAVVLILGLVSLNSGLTLMGSPLALSNWFPQKASKSQQQQVVPSGEPGATLTLQAANDGYSPYTLVAQAGVPITLNVVTSNTVSCARAFVIPSLGIEEILPRTGTISISLPAQEAGTTLRYSCSMGMYDGEIVFEGDG